MKILVTGGTGFIGKYVLDKLVNHGHKVRCLVRKSSDLSSIKHLNVELVYGDIRDKESIIRSIKGVDAVIHLANIYEFWIENKKDYWDTNVIGSQNLFEVCVAEGVHKIVHVSTLAVYGNPRDSVFTEESELGKNRYSKYAKSKAEGDKIAWSLYRRKGLPLVIVYPGAVTGPGDTKSTGRYLSDIINKKMPAQVFTNRSLTWVDVRDVADIIVASLEHEKNIGQKYFAAAERLTIGEINKLISELSGVNLPKLILPDVLVLLNARILTFFADILKKSPMLGMSIDQIRTMKHGFMADGTKVEKEFGISYIPIKKSIEDAIYMMRKSEKSSYLGEKHFST